MTSAVLPALPDINQNNILDALERIKEILEIYQGLRGPDKDNDSVLSLTSIKSQILNPLRCRPKNGVSGYFDDGANFRVTFENGIITGVAASTAAGFSLT